MGGWPSLHGAVFPLRIGLVPQESVTPGGQVPGDHRVPSLGLRVDCRAGKVFEEWHHVDGARPVLTQAVDPLVRTIALEGHPRCHRPLVCDWNRGRGEADFCHLEEEAAIADPPGGEEV